MGIYDRDYTQDDFRHRFHNAPQMRMVFPKITPVVKWLLIINGAVFLTAIIIRPVGVVIYRWFQLDPASLGRALQLWRLITYQFLHDPSNVFHIAFNMLGLFFLGPTLERHLGGKKFLIFYLSCGVAGGAFYLFLVGAHFLQPLPMIGASGAILGLLAACAILFPQFVVFILLFPVPIRVAAVLFTFIFIVFVVTREQNAGGHAAHLAGMAAGAFYVVSESWRAKIKLKIHAGKRQKKFSQQRNLQQEVDRILQKVQQSGIHSLTREEKKTLKRATEVEQMRNQL